MKATIRTEITGELVEAGGGEPPVEPAPPAPRTPWFEIGDVQGKAGSEVWVPVHAGCHLPMDGFHIGGGLAGYGNVKALGVSLGDYLTKYLKGQGLITEDESGEEAHHYFSLFQYVNWTVHRALPEDWWEYAMAFFSIDQARPPTTPISIPSGTELFRVRMAIDEKVGPGELELSCKDEWYYTSSVQRRRNFEYTMKPQGFTAIDCFGGKITVTA